MALKPTIFKTKIALSDIERNHYDTLNLTVAQHPSETVERMMVRVLAFCLNAQENLSFTKGLCDPDQPDIIGTTLDDQIALWVDVGEPNPDRIKKATRVARTVRVYTFNSKSDIWWSQENSRFAELEVEVFQIPWEGAQALAALVERTMDMSVTITGNTVYVATGNGECEVTWKVLQVHD